MSLGLTAANIVLIWISAALMFKIKEVLPIKESFSGRILVLLRKIYKRQALIKSHPPESEVENEQHVNLDWVQ